MKNLWFRISDTGITPGMDSQLIKKIRITNQVVFSLSVIAFSYLFIFYFLGFKKEGIAVSGVVGSMIVPLLLNYYRLYSLARIWFLISINAAVFIYAHLFGAEAGIQLAYFSFVSIPWLIFQFTDKPYILSGVIMPAAGYILITGNEAEAMVTITPAIQQSIQMTISVVTFLILTLSITFFVRQEYLSEKYLVTVNNELLASQQSLDLRNEKLREIAWIQSHELRKPLASILGLIQVINYDDLADPDNEITFKHIRSAGEELDSIIAEIDKKTHISDL